MAKKSQRYSVGKRMENITKNTNSSEMAHSNSSRVRMAKDQPKPPVHLLPIANLAQAYDEVPVNGTSAPNIAELIRHTRQAELYQQQQQVLEGSHMRVSSSPQRSSSWKERSASSAPASLMSRAPLLNRSCEEEEEVGNYSSSSSLGVYGVRQMPSKGPGGGGGSMDKIVSLPSSPLQISRTPLKGYGSAPRQFPPSLSTGGSARGGLSGSNSSVLSTNKRAALLNGSCGAMNSFNTIPDVSYSSLGESNSALGTRWNSSTREGSGGQHSFAPLSSSLPPSNVSESGIIVGVRIRPFNRKEVEELMTEKQRRKQNPALSASARLASTLNRPKERQPFGPGREDIAGALHSVNGSGVENLTLTSNGEVVGNPLENCELEVLLDDHGHPLPVMEVLNDGRTLVLIDPLKQQGLTPDRSSKFTFDYIYSSFAPSIEIPGLDGTISRGTPHSNDIAESSAIHSPLSPPLIGGLEVDLTPEQEKLAELEQQSIYVTLGLPLITSALEGYNACIFAYGQTSSGKTYTMMGTKKHPGVIPRLCKELFRLVEEARDGYTKTGSLNTIKIDVCYLEIYNEQVRDLLKQRPKNAILHYNSRFDTKDVEYQEYQTLKVRHHPERGVFVDGLTSVTVESWADCGKILRQGDALRTQASTAMNATSSRSHAIFQLMITQSDAVGAKVRGKQVMNQRVSKVNLVDLSGSERNSKAESMGKHLVEASSINSSLSTLRRVLEAIISKKKVVPYRESLLTYVLSDNFGGNSKTVMCANVSPHAVNFSETDSTLRYATIARDVLNKAKVNESPNCRLIRELKDRARTLQEALSNVSSPSNSNNVDLNMVQAMEGEVRQYQERLQGLELQRSRLQEQVKEQENDNYRLMKALRKKKMQEEVWRREAEKQRKQKEKLRQAFRLLVKAHPDMVQSVLFPDEKKEREENDEERGGGCTHGGGMRFEEDEESEIGKTNHRERSDSGELPLSFANNQHLNDLPRGRKESHRRASLNRSQSDDSQKEKSARSSSTSSEEDEERLKKEQNHQQVRYQGHIGRNNSNNSNNNNNFHNTTSSSSSHGNSSDAIPARESDNKGIHRPLLAKRPSSLLAAPPLSPPAARAVANTASSSGELESKHLQALRSLQSYQGIIRSSIPSAHRSDTFRHSQTLSGNSHSRISPDPVEEGSQPPSIPSFLPSSISLHSVDSSSLPLVLPKLSHGGDALPPAPPPPPQYREALSPSFSSSEFAPQPSPLTSSQSSMDQEDIALPSPCIDVKVDPDGRRSSSMSSSQLRLGLEMAQESPHKKKSRIGKDAKKRNRKHRSNGKNGTRNKNDRRNLKGASVGHRGKPDAPRSFATQISPTTAS